MRPRNLWVAAVALALLAVAPAEPQSVSDRTAEGLTLQKPKHVWTVQQFRQDQRDAMLHFINQLPEAAQPYVVVTEHGINGWFAVFYRVPKGGTI